MTESKYIEKITEEYGKHAEAVYSAAMGAVEEYSFGKKSTAYINGCIKRIHKGDAKALADLAAFLYNMTGSPTYKI